MATIQPAREEDIENLATISTYACASDTHTRLQELHTPGKTNMRPALSTWFARPPSRCQVIKALVGEQIVGWAAWAFVGLEAEDQSAFVADRDVGEQELEFELPQPPVNRPEEPALDKRNMESLRALTDASMAAWQASLRPRNARCVILLAISVSPASQGQGVGSSLISWGTRIADARGVHAWVSSSMAGVTAFERAGFVEVGNLKVRLDDYCEGVRNPERDDGRWDYYVWNYMVRKARRGGKGNISR